MFKFYLLFESAPARSAIFVTQYFIISYISAILRWRCIKCFNYQNQFYICYPDLLGNETNFIQICPLFPEIRVQTNKHTNEKAIYIISNILSMTVPYQLSFLLKNV